MLGTYVNEFTDLVEIRERIDTNIQEKKLFASQGDNTMRKGLHSKKKEGEIGYIQMNKGIDKSNTGSYQHKGNGKELSSPVSYLAI